MFSLIKIILSILLFLCLLDMPYGFYQLVRFAALVGFGILAYDAHKKDNMTLVVVYAALALLFQPFFKIALGGMLWNIVDVVVGVFLLISLLIKKELHKEGGDSTN
ncbi:hypothetical protein QSE00_23585 [Arenibacter sp. M-2]|uniref:DUF6804 family protein n=1 Tax=Arenibacter sp. M-2 TaxID=3053612 RepID=UPI00257051B2|nr:DUF6804 family protein [Arenibacter sp. M-2]MDL5514812.1 hypothetical protein [Arenibacter sp. M-2]